MVERGPRSSTGIFERPRRALESRTGTRIEAFLGRILPIGPSSGGAGGVGLDEGEAPVTMFDSRPRAIPGQLPACKTVGCHPWNSPRRPP